jgi:hypothetical protein
MSLKVPKAGGPELFKSGYKVRASPGLCTLAPRAAPRS